jgi:hypothetical protein
MNKTVLVAALAVLALLPTAPAMADSRRDSILADLLAQAQRENPSLTGFAAERGEMLFRAQKGGGKPDTPSCTTCHGETPQTAGETRAGKPIDPIAVSAAPKRFTDPAEVDKWFGRNCNSVLGRECTATEKGDFITFMMGQ